MSLKKVLTLGAVLGAAAAAGTGCAENRTSLYIDSVQGFEPDDECTVDADLGSDSTIITHGVFDPQAGADYQAPLVIGNQLVPRGDNDTLRPETSRIQLEGAVIEVREAGTETLALQPYTSYFGATVHPVSSSAPGLVVATVPLIRRDAALDDGQYQISIKVFGTTLGGKELESGDFLFPLTVDSGYVSSICPDYGTPHPCGWPQDGFCYAEPDDDD